jgi:hypothetical protein
MNNAVGIATGYGLDGQDSMPGKGKNYILVHSAQTGSGAHPASPPIGTGTCFPGGRAAEV